jgi:hypothetical protein
LQESEAKTLFFGNLVATCSQCFPIRAHPLLAHENLYQPLLSRTFLLAVRAYGAVVVGDIAPEEDEGTAEIWASLAFPASVKRYR